MEWMFGVVGIVVVGGMVWCAYVVVIGKYVYTKSWSDILYVCAGLVCICIDAVLHSIRSIVDYPLPV